MIDREIPFQTVGDHIIDHTRISSPKDYCLLETTTELRQKRVLKVGFAVKFKGFKCCDPNYPRNP